MILTLVYWRAVLLRALYTVLAAALPLMAPLVAGGWDAARQALLALAFAAVLSIATSLANLPETGGTRALWVSVLDRVVRTFAQTFAAALAAAAAFSDVDWRTLLVQAAVAAGVTLLRTVIDFLPETIPIAEVDWAEAGPDSEPLPPADPSMYGPDAVELDAEPAPDQKRES